MSQIEKRTYLFLVLAIWVYVLIRAALVPIVHDEAATFLHYIQLNQFIPYFAMWDANNHLLNTAFGHFFVNLFSDHTFWLRLPNALTFLIFAYYLQRICAEIPQTLLRWLTLIALLTATFQLDFFSQARGYGMGTAFLIAAIYSASRYVKTPTVMQQLKVWFFMTLALLANMSLLNTQIALMGIFAFVLLSRQQKHLPKHGLLLLAIGGGVLLIASLYALKMRAMGLLYTGSLDGFVQVTVFSFARFQFDAASMLLAWLIFAFGLVVCLTLVLRWVQNRLVWNMGGIIGGLLVLNALGSVLLEMLLNVNYPEERTGLYFLTLTLLATGFAASEGMRWNRRFALLGLPLIYFPLQFLLTLNFCTSQLWFDQHIDRQIYSVVLKEQSAQDTPLRISGGRIHELSWAHLNIINKSQLPLLETKHHPDPGADLVLIHQSSNEPIDFEYTILFTSPCTGFSLIKPKRTQAFETLPDTLSLAAKALGNPTYFNLAEWKVDSIAGECGLLNFGLSANSMGNPMHVQIVIKAENAEGKKLSYEIIPLYWVRKHWKDDELLVHRYYRFPPGATRAIVYLWNIGENEFEVEHSAVTRKLCMD
ncbi:MAG: hypothetical protein EA392_06605 [Cryomorphaceae bacterium]|nr:MAG: hypothetical protein EA392_06605 [Cryomorphaceae bacterium]